MHKALYRDDLTLEQAQVQMAQIAERMPEGRGDVQMMLAFLAQTTAQRGIVR
jgi:UDP-N-acetylglucosamine acyltransferase